MNVTQGAPVSLLMSAFVAAAVARPSTMATNVAPAVIGAGGAVLGALVAFASGQLQLRASIRLNAEQAREGRLQSTYVEAWELISLATLYLVTDAEKRQDPHADPFPISLMPITNTRVELSMTLYASSKAQSAFRAAVDAIETARVPGCAWQDLPEERPEQAKRFLTLASQAEAVTAAFLQVIRQELGPESH